MGFPIPAYPQENNHFYLSPSTHYTHVRIKPSLKWTWKLQQRHPKYQATSVSDNQQFGKCTRTKTEKKEIQNL